MENRKRIGHRCLLGESSLWVAVAALLLALSFPGRGIPPAAAQEKFPEKAVTIVVPFGAGGGTDVFARAIQPFVSKYLKSPVVIENVPGANGSIGYHKVYTAKPDGYTLTTCNWPDIYTDKIMFNPAYDPSRFTPIVGWASMPMVLAANADFENFNQFMQTARKRKVTIGQAGGIGSTGWVLNLSIEKGTGVEFSKVPYSASGAVAAAVAGKHLDAMIMVPSAIASFVKTGQIKPLVALYQKRIPSLPDTPTTQELGYTFPVFAIFRGVIGTPNIPAERVKILEEALMRAVRDPEYLKLCEKMNILVTPMASQEYGKKMNEAVGFLEPFAELLKKK